MRWRSRPCAKARSPASCTSSASPTSCSRSSSRSPASISCRWSTATNSQDYYMPAELTAADYPNLIPPGRDDADHLGAGASCRLQLEARIPTATGAACASWNIYSTASTSCACRPIQPGWKDMNLAGTIPGLDALPARAGDAQQGTPPRGRCDRPDAGARAGGRVPRPTTQLSRSGCSSSFWSGANNRNANSRA